LKTVFCRIATALLLSMFVPQLAMAGVTVYESEDVTMELGLRIQTRLSFERGEPASGTDAEWQRDFVVRRTRMKIGGKAMTATYYLEWRLDGTGTNAGTEGDPSPISGVENAYIQLPVAGPGVQVRAGLYDQPFSRDRLTSDSKQLAVDRGAVSNVPAGLGLADNAIGVDVRGSLRDGTVQYVAGVYDNRTIPSSLQNSMPMVIGRLDLNLGSTSGIYSDAQFGDDSWYCLGVNAGYQGALEDTLGADDGSNLVLGADGMADVPAGAGRLHVRAEVNSLRIEAPSAGPLTTVAWMLGAGYLIGERIQPIVRFDQVKEDDDVGGRITNATKIGGNLYLRGHNLKIQADVTIASGTGDKVDRGRLQAQLDF